MYEVLTISVSQRANHLATQFYNCQEEALANSNPKDSIDPSIYLNPIIDRISKTVSYEPRALLWEAKNGFGSLGQYQYIPESQDYHFNQNTQNPTDANIISTQPKVERSEYQQALDLNPYELPPLTVENTKYWSDYAKLIFGPKSFNSLQNWYHKVDSPNKPDYQNLDQCDFSTFEQGVQEFEVCKDDFFDTNLRYMLEQADTLQGINLITDLDSGWGGFSSQLLQELRDELPKSTFFTFGFNEPDMFSGLRQSNNITRNKIKSTLQIRQESDLFFPLFADVQNLSNWQIGGQNCRLLDTITSVISQRNEEQRRSMDHLVQCLSGDDQLRNVITSMYDTSTNYDYSYHPRVKQWEKTSHKYEDYHEFAHCLINRNGSVESLTDEKTEEEVKKPNKFNDIRELFTTKFRPSDTISEEYTETELKSVKMTTSEKSRDVFKNWNMYISRAFKLDEDREELKDETSNLATAYETGYYDDEDSGDDDV